MIYYLVMIGLKKWVVCRKRSFSYRPFQRYTCWDTDDNCTNKYRQMLSKLQHRLLYKGNTSVNDINYLIVIIKNNISSDSLFSVSQICNKVEQVAVIIFVLVCLRYENVKPYSKRCSIWHDISKCFVVFN